MGNTYFLVREKRLELLHPKALEPKSSASTNSATLAGSNGLTYRRFEQAGIIAQLLPVATHIKRIRCIFTSFIVLS